jgi:hypothetical protein
MPVEVQAVFLALKPTMLANIVPLAVQVLYSARRPVHLEEQLHGLHDTPCLHPEVVPIDVECLLQHPTVKIIVLRDCCLLLFRHALQDRAAITVHPHVRLAAR